MIIKGMDHFQNLCRQRLQAWYNDEANDNTLPFITFDQTFCVWSVKALQNYKGLFSTAVSGDGIYAEFTYNGDKQELYMDVYKKQQNICIKGEDK